MATYISNTDVTEGLIVTAIALLLLGILFLFSRRNKILLRFIESQYKPRHAELKIDTTGRDWLLFIVLLVIVIILGLKMVTPMVVISDSMKPEFQRGDMIMVQSVFLTPEPGDIVTFNLKNKNYDVSHRVISTGNEAIITKGDNNPRKDEYSTKQEDIKAKAILINSQPIVIKNLGALFITDYSKQGVIYKYGDQFTFLQQLSATIKAWGIVITIFALFGYIIMMQKDNR
jgi:signal peptidase